MNDIFIIVTEGPMSYIKRLIIIIVLLLSAGAYIALRDRAKTQQGVLEVLNSQPETNIVFAGHLYSYTQSFEQLFHDLKVHEADVFVFGGDAIRSTVAEGRDYPYIDDHPYLEYEYLTAEYNDDLFEQATEAATEQFEHVIHVKGNHDRSARIFDKKPEYGSVRVNNVENIFLNTETFITSSVEAGCSIDEDQLTLLKNVVTSSDAQHKIIYMHYGLWDDTTYIKTESSSNGCIGQYWNDFVVPIIKNQVSHVISGDGWNVKLSYRESHKDGITYVLTGSPIHKRVIGEPEQGDFFLASFAYITVRGDRITTQRLDIPDRELMNAINDGAASTYHVTVNDKDLTHIYSRIRHGGKDTDSSTIHGQIMRSASSYPTSGRIIAETEKNSDPHKKSWQFTYDNKLLSFESLKDSSVPYLEEIGQRAYPRTLGTTETAQLVINGIDFGVYKVSESNL